MNFTNYIKNLNEKILKIVTFFFFEGKIVTVFIDKENCYTFINNTVSGSGLISNVISNQQQKNSPFLLIVFTRKLFYGFKIGKCFVKKKKVSVVNEKIYFIPLRITVFLIMCDSK